MSNGGSLPPNPPNPPPLGSGARSVPGTRGCGRSASVRAKVTGSLAAAAGSSPELYVTRAFGAFARIAFRGEEGNQTVPPPKPPSRRGRPGRAGGGGTAFPPGGSTCAEPPPDSTPTSACDPITAIDF